MCVPSQHSPCVMCVYLSICSCVCMYVRAQLFVSKHAVLRVCLLMFCVCNVHTCMSAHVLCVFNVHVCMSAHVLCVFNVHICMSAHVLCVQRAYMYVCSCFVCATCIYVCLHMFCVCNVHICMSAHVLCVFNVHMCSTFCPPAWPARVALTTPTSMLCL